MDRNKQILRGLSHEQYEHPFDKAALETLEKSKVLPIVGHWITSNFIERIFKIQYTGSNLKVTGANFPKIYDYLDYACEVLDVPTRPELYIQWGYEINAFTVGVDNPIIVLNSGTIELCNDDEILFIIGHELGHYCSKHTLYQMIAQYMSSLLSLAPGPITKLLTASLQYTLYYWYRMSEFTADRSGLLCCQNIDAAVSAFMKMAGVPKDYFDDMNKDSFIQQARDFKMLDEDGMYKLIKVLSIADDDHPWTVMRSAELLKWINDGVIQQIITF